MRFDVHIYPTIRIKIENVQADNIQAAIDKATSIDLHDLIDNVLLNRPVGDEMRAVGMEWDEGEIPFVLVDTFGDDGKQIDPDGRFFECNGQELVEGKTQAERKSAGYDAAALFMQELLDSCESLTDLEEQYGTRTLIDLMYLQHAIMSGGHIDVWSEHSMVREVVDGLPSKEEWQKYLKDADAPQDGSRPKG